MEETKQNKKVIQEVDPYAIKKAREEAEPFAPSKELQIEKKKSSGKRALEIEKRESVMAEIAYNLKRSSSNSKTQE